MGLINQAIRTIKDYLGKLWGSIFHKKKKRRMQEEDEDEETIRIPASWKKPARPGEKPANRKQIVVEKHKIRVPGLRWFKRALAGSLLFINFIFSQFLLSRMGDQGQSLFILFLLNCFIMADYLWKTRRPGS
jgi:hypothetical protein